MASTGGCAASIGIEGRLAAGTPQDVIVEYEAKDIDPEATAPRAGAGLLHDDPATLTCGASRFAAFTPTVGMRTSAPSQRCIGIES